MSEQAETKSTGSFSHSTQVKTDVLTGEVKVAVSIRAQGANSETTRQIVGLLEVAVRQALTGIGSPEGEPLA